MRNKITLRSIKLLRRLKADRRGVSAIEFALIFPILIVLLAGTTDLGQALIVHRKMNQIVATASDLVTQESSWSASRLDAILKGTASIILPFDAKDLKITVSVIDVDPLNNAWVHWSRSYNGKALSPGDKSPVEIPADIVENGVQLVVATASYKLTTPFAAIMKSIVGSSSYDYSRYSIMRPRVQSTIQLH